MLVFKYCKTFEAPFQMQNVCFQQLSNIIVCVSDFMIELILQLTQTFTIQ